MNIEWLDTAREDITAVYSWYAKESPKAAIKLCRGIMESVGLHFPYLGLSAKTVQTAPQCTEMEKITQFTGSSNDLNA